ncbi:hypothetical protein CSB45_06100 [candidate division KSB3 bacterium]|uniref:Deoxyhypusine synthase n=1 Tax=candidate division KSB3 bacterium TaxID=2044937 RepID=A0A2G6E721_9BACT|nr:MAG: hypothetical protein CSB45_06100 [candidate division KSB3 bacterium]PIE30310.1 MAG: hypothetical protein CSA57_04815 [candidate division KSB3 bacterium]
MKTDFPEIDFSKISTYSIFERKSLVQIENFAIPWKKGACFERFMASLPNILAGAQFQEVVAAVATAVQQARPVVMAMGAHVIKCGLSPLIIDLMERGILSAVALNGAGIIHDFEIAYTGHTSEDVAEAISSGKFGMGRETGYILNEAITRGRTEGWGMGESVGRAIIASSPPYLQHSLIAAAVRLELPVTVHASIGTDIIHMHPNADGASLGEASHLDFKRYVGVISQLEGGVYFNIGSAVILPEVFLKAVSAARNLGYELKRFTTVNMDFIRHYRPAQNVVSRPASDGGKGYSLIGHHEILLPLLAAAIIERV